MNIVVRIFKLSCIYLYLLTAVSPQRLSIQPGWFALAKTLHYSARNQGCACIPFLLMLT